MSEYKDLFGHPVEPKPRSRTKRWTDAEAPQPICPPQRESWLSGIIEWLASVISDALHQTAVKILVTVFLLLVGLLLAWFGLPRDFDVWKGGDEPKPWITTIDRTR